MFDTLKPVLLILSAVVLSSCTTLPIATPDAFITQYGIKTITPQNFSLCYGHGCTKRVSVALMAPEWASVKDIFRPQAADPAAERDQIAKAVRRLEQITGKKTGIDSDIGGTFPGMFRGNQMDCEDEAVNTNTFLLLFQQDNLIRYNRIYGIARRGNFLFSWPHMATAVMDTQTGMLYVVDSWFFDQGMPVHIVPEAKWKSGWRPEPEAYSRYFNQPSAAR